MTDTQWWMPLAGVAGLVASIAVGYPLALAALKLYRGEDDD